MSTSPYAANQYSAENENSWTNMFELIPDGSTVLDVGCSSGNFGAALQTLKSCTVVGIDINSQDVALAREKLSAAYVIDVTVPEALDELGTFDVIVVADVLEHLIDPRSALRSLRERLTDDGIVVFSIPHMGHMSVRLDMLEGRFPYTDLGLLDRTHLHFYDRVEVHDVFARAGFSIVTERPVVSQYPAAWLDGRLAEIGLNASPLTHAMLQRTEAHVYQYVGVAVPRATEPIRPGLLRELVSPPDSNVARANELIEQNRALVEENDKLSRANRSLIRDVTELRYLVIPQLIEGSSQVRQRPKPMARTQEERPPAED